jgi:glycerophosphoryl diester phosphodiesterase
MAFKLAALLLFMLASCGGAQRIQVHGHRGARAVRPENTIPAFEYAIAAGADVLELDMAVTSDDRVVVSHDLRMNRTICRGPEGETAIRRLTLAQVREWDCGSLRNPEFQRQTPAPGAKMPLLEEVFALAAEGSFEFNIETKMSVKEPDLSPEPELFARLVVEAVRRHRLERRVIVQSFDFRTLAAIRKLAPGIRLSALYSGAPRDLMEIAREAGGAQIVSPHYLLTSRESVRRAHQQGLIVVPWTANTPAQWESLVEQGVDAIITDDPGGLIEFLKRKGMR